MKEKHSSISFADLPEIISYKDYANYMGIGENKAREKFNSKGFPLLKGVGNKKLANKYSVFLYDMPEDMRALYAAQFARQMIK